MQIFSRVNPQYDFFWQFEMDSRYTGHFYNFLEQAADFARQQPRKNLWERNSYFYIPAVHGSWDNFIDQVDQSMMVLIVSGDHGLHKVSRLEMKHLSRCTRTSTQTRMMMIFGAGA